MKKFWLALVLVCSLSGCASVPPEVVALSRLSNDDTRALNNSYRALVRKHFEALRKLREQEFAASVLAPYIEDAVNEGRLVEVVQGKIVYDSVKGAYVPPDPAMASFQKLDTLNTWSREVAIEIEKLRKEAYGDLSKQENDTLDAVDQAFGNVLRGEAAVHGYLLSIQKVDAAQNDFLKGIGLEGFPKKLSDSLDKASEDAAKNTEKLKRAADKARGILKKAKGS